MFTSDNELGDSSMSINEPRLPRPFLINRGLEIPPQVSEPSLYSEDVLTNFKESFQPRATVAQTSPVKSPGFIPQLTPLSVLKKTTSWAKNTSPCGCKTPPLNATGIVMSPSIDPEIKELIQDQNRQLNLLQKQVKQLLQYQERLQDQLGDKQRANGATQTSSYFDVQSPKCHPSARFFSQSNSGSPTARQQQDRTEITLTFRDLQLETIVEQPPSPQPSFVVNMQDYQESVSDQLDESTESCENVMEHVQKLLAQANISNGRKPLMEKAPEMNVENKTPERHVFHDMFPENPTRKVTMQRVQELGISFINPFALNTPRNPVYYPRSNAKSYAWDARKETDQSVEMERLAEKYLGQSKPVENKTLDYTFKTSKSVEMSMSSQQYLERYGLHEYAESSSR
ncbi:Uncharacterized protein APZ42_023065 [Daphnia magna]|uniref:Uncharacterized protein n=2 Tax=Daphnia magna TaxID=35525 RepID=A0A0P5ZAB0_9CRUS|nr:hypothetical protein OUZ56_003395 [Daphnia magna]KZS12086.1 Uncharacterized protein APZ42_023065 [Daphnia magna]